MTKWWRKRKGRVIGALAVALVLSCVLGPYALWHLQSPTRLSVVIVDKSVAKPAYRKHAGLIWVLNHEKIAQPGADRRFDPTRDYVGYHPAESGDKRIVPIPDTPTDLAYISDTYGVYEGDVADSPTLNRSKLVYGGMSVDEVRRLTGNLRPGGTLIGEFSSLGSPTPIAARALLASTFGVRPTGWVGRHMQYLDLTPDLPQWMPRAWRKQTGTRWAFRGPGYVFASEAGELVVLVEGVDTPVGALTMHVDTSTAATYGTVDQLRYDGWVEILAPTDRARVIATYDLRLNASGVKKMRNVPISGRFPAVVRTATQQRTTYYFAGDWSDRTNDGRYDYRGIERFKRMVTSDDRDDTEKMFWTVYVPMMAHIIDETVSNRRLADVR